MQRLLYLLFGLGGFAALVYEVLWMRSFRLVFGSSTRSAAAVLAAFFAGMALGSWIGARLSRRPRPVRLYGWAEIAIGLSALLVAPWLLAFDAVYPELYTRLEGRPLALQLAKLALAGLALGPPAVAMGATLPLVSRALVERAEHVARRTGLLYACNVLGATAGALAAAFVLPPWLGVRGSVLLAAALSLAIGAVALRLGRDGQGSAPTPAPERPAGSLLLAVAGVSGLGTLALQVLFVRLLSQRSEGSVYTFGLMLAIFLLCLAAGSLWVSRVLDRTNPWRFLAWTQLGAVAAILLAPLLFDLIPALTLFSKEDSLAVRLARFGSGSLVVLGAPVCLIGVVLPATWKLAATGAARIGERVGALTALNTLGGVAGSLLAGFVLLPALGLGGSTLAVASLYAALAALGCARGYAGPRRWAGVAACAALPALWLGLGGAGLRLQPLAEGERLVRYEDGEAASVAVTQGRDGHRVLRLDHAYVLGSSAAWDRELRQGRLPLLLHPRPRSVAFIGVATGMTASALLDFPVERAVALEIIPGVLDALPDFAAWNRSFFRDPRVRLVAADGRNHLRGTRERFDVVIGDLFVPWHAGTGDLYSVEHFQAVARRLAPGGFFAQWLPGYQLTPRELRIVAASFLEAFPHAVLFRGDFHAEMPLLALVGYPDGAALDPEALRRQAAALGRGRGPPAPFLSSPEGLALLYVSDGAALGEWAQGAPRNRDDRPIIEYETPHSVFVHKQQGLAAQRVLAGLRPRRWAYAEPLPLEVPVETLLAAADRMQDAVVARLEHNFEREYRHLTELAESAAGLPGVSGFLLEAAGRYRTRKMTSRGEALLEALVREPSPPLAALLALAELQRGEGRDLEAAALLERALERAPEAHGVRRSLAELLAGAGLYERAEPHLRRLVEAAPDDPGPGVELAVALDRLGRSEEAAAEVRRVLALEEGEGRAGLWRLLRRRGLAAHLERRSGE